MKPLFLIPLLLISLHSFSQGSLKNGDVGKFLYEWSRMFSGSRIYIDDSAKSYQNYLTLKFTVNADDYHRHTFIDSLITSIKGYRIAKMNRYARIYVVIRMAGLINIFQKTKRVLYISPEGKLHYDKDFKVEL